jgi:hypothetical protein
VANQTGQRGDAMTTKQELRRLVDALPDDQLNDLPAWLLEELHPESLARVLKRVWTFDHLTDLVAHLQGGMSPLERTLHTAPIDDEPVTAEEEAAIAEARAELAKGEPCLSLADIKREFGLDDGAPIYTRATLHTIVDELPDSALNEAGRRLEELARASNGPER